MTLQGVKRKIVTVSDFRFTGRLLGKGNFARVEEAIHSALNMKVAVKIINIKEVKEKYVLKNLHREARIMSTLDHPCIAALFQTMQLADNVYYLVTELVPGGDLCSFIIGQRYGKLDERLARVYARQFASALSHMHSFGIVHRDLKMENVILNSTQTQIKIVDFGLSNVWTSDSPLRTHCGSPEYAAPELFIAGKEYGPEVDLWSLGIIFYGMVVGQLPFVSGRKTQVSSQERRKKLVAQINKGLGNTQRHAIATLSPEFRSMINKLLMADPVKRIKVQELLAHPWITEKGRKWVQAHPLKKLDQQWQNKFTKQIGDSFQVDDKNVLAEIYKNPYGRMGGMMNILNYKHSNALFNPDSIAIDTKHLANRKQLLINEERKVEHLYKPKSADVKSTSHNSGLYNQCAVLLNKVYKQQQIESRVKSANPNLESNGKVSLSRNTRSATTKNDGGNQKSSKATYSKVIITRNKMVEPGIYSLRKTISAKTHNHVADGDNHKKEVRPMTTGAVRPGIAKTLKRTSLPTATISTTNNNKIVNNKDYYQRIVPACGPNANGDAKRPNVVSSKTQAKLQRLANDPPITRSIAGYLVKNIPDKMFNLQMTRK